MGGGVAFAAIALHCRIRRDRIRPVTGTWAELWIRHENETGSFATPVRQTRTPWSADRRSPRSLRPDTSDRPAAAAAIATACQTLPRRKRGYRRSILPHAASASTAEMPARGCPWQPDLRPDSVGKLSAIIDRAHAVAVAGDVMAGIRDLTGESVPPWPEGRSYASSR